MTKPRKRASRALTPLTPPTKLQPRIDVDAENSWNVELTTEDPITGYDARCYISHRDTTLAAVAVTVGCKQETYGWWRAHGPATIRAQVNLGDGAGDYFSLEPQREDFSSYVPDSCRRSGWRDAQRDWKAQLRRYGATTAAEAERNMRVMVLANLTTFLDRIKAMWNEKHPPTRARKSRKGRKTRR